MKLQGVSSLSLFQTDYTALSSGSKINSAADNAAGLAISNKLQAQSNGLSVASSNAKAGQDMLRVANGALATMQDSLQRIRELSVKAGNGIYTASDLKSIQQEIDGLKQDIQGAAKGTNFNTKKLLDGSTADLNLAVNPQGNGRKIQMADTTLETLGIADYDITNHIDFQAIDRAIEMVSEARGSMGAQSNALDYTINVNDITRINTISSISKITDTDYAEEITEQKKNQVVDQYKIFTQKAQMQNQSAVLKLFT